MLNIHFKMDQIPNREANMDKISTEMKIIQKHLISFSYIPSTIVL